jgi:prevent-host-death family protein
MVIWTILMTMSTRSHRWSVASAKAELSRVVQSAQRRPQVIERRGKPVAVVVAVEQFKDSDSEARWQAFLDVSAQIRASGGAELRLIRRDARRCPLLSP